jgi:hypothetical protein
MHAHESPVTRTILIRVDPGDDLLAELQAAVDHHAVRDGIFISGAGSLTRTSYHVVSSTDLPPENAFVEREGAVDIVAITGAVLGGRVHAHVTVTDTEIAFGGHLEPGCTVLTFAMVALAETPAQDLSAWDHVPGRQ